MPAVFSFLQRGWFGLSHDGTAALGPVFHPLQQLGGPKPVAFFTILLGALCIVLRRYRCAVMLGMSVVAASALTEYVLKPLVGRTYGESLSFPSGHATGAFALITGFIVVLAGPPVTSLRLSVRIALALAAVAIGCATALGLVAAWYHYFTDTIAGGAVGITVTLATALALDWVGSLVHVRTAQAAPAKPARANSR